MRGIKGKRLLRLMSLALLVSISLFGCSERRDSFLQPGGPIAAAQRAHLFDVVALTMIVVLPVFILVPLFLWRYRYRNKKARYTPNWAFSGWLDLLMWGVPLIIVVILSTMLWRSTKKLDPYQPIATAKTQLQMQVVGLDWKWLFIYPELGIATVNQLAFPVEASVALDLTTDTVMQSFMIPALAGQSYAMPGMRTQLHVLADAPGIFVGENTQFNGRGFTEQKFVAQAMQPEDFTAWVAQVRERGKPLDATTYGHLAQPSTGAEAHQLLGSAHMPDGVLYFNAIPPKFFADIIHRYHSGAAVLPAQQPGAVGYVPPAENGAEQ